MKFYRDMTADEKREVDAEHRDYLENLKSQAEWNMAYYDSLSPEERQSYRDELDRVESSDEYVYIEDLHEEEYF